MKKRRIGPPLAALALSATAVCAAHASPAAAEPMVPGGDTARNAPSVEAGIHPTLMTATAGTYYYRIERTTPGSSLWVGLANNGSSAGIIDEMQLRAADGTRCSRQPGLDWTSPEVAVPMASVTSHDPDAPSEGPCRTDNELILEVTKEATDDPVPESLVVIEEPPLAGDPELPPPAGRKDSTPTEMPIQQPVPVDGGRDIAAAKEIGSGTYADVISPGESRVYRIPLTWGEYLQAEVRIDALDGEGRLRRLDESALHLSIASPSLGRAAFPRTTSPNALGDRITPGGREQTALSVSAPVRYANRDSAGEVGSAAIPGYYYVVVSMSDTPVIDESAAITYDLAVQKLREPGQGDPGYGDLVTGTSGPGKGPSTGSTGGSAESGGDTPSSAADTGHGDGEPPWDLTRVAGAGAGLGGLAALAAALVVWRRRRA